MSDQAVLLPKWSPHGITHILFELWLITLLWIVSVFLTQTLFHMLLKFTEGSYYVAELLIDTYTFFLRKKTWDILAYMSQVCRISNFFMALSALVHTTWSYILISWQKKSFETCDKLKWLVHILFVLPNQISSKNRNRVIVLCKRTIMSHYLLFVDNLMLFHWILLKCVQTFQPFSRFVFRCPNLSFPQPKY